MNEFKTYHPIVDFIYFLFVIGLSMFLMHPVCLAISLVSALFLSMLLKGAKALKNNLLYMVPMFIFMAAINPLFNHEGATVLAYLPDGNPLTLESVFYGFVSATMIAGVICWFSCYNEVMTSDKFIYLFGRIIPSLSLIFSMTLRFVPRFAAQLKVIINARKCLGHSVKKGSILKRLKNALTVLSVMITWSLENAIETADSMKARGYGCKGRTSFSLFRFDKRDATMLVIILVSGIYILFAVFYDAFYFNCFPYIKMAEITFISISGFVAYTILCALPIIIEIREVRRWKYSK